MQDAEMAAKIAAKIERQRREMQDLAENPEIARSTIGLVVLDMIGRGEEISVEAMVEALESLADGTKHRAGLNEVFAKGALKVISDLRSPAG